MAVIFSTPILEFFDSLAITCVEESAAGTLVINNRLLNIVIMAGITIAALFGFAILLLSTSNVCMIMMMMRKIMNVYY